MQICIDPTNPEGIDATLHRSHKSLGDRCKLASISQGLGGSMQICIDGSMQICMDPPNAGGIDANLSRWVDANVHRSVRRWGDR